MSLAPPEATGPLRRERLRTARLYFVCDARPGAATPSRCCDAALAGGVDIVQLREKERAAPRDRAGGAHLPPPLRHLQRPLHRQRRPRAGPGLQRRRGPRRPGRHARRRGAASCSARRRSSGSRPTPRSRSPPAAEAPVDYISVGPVWETPTKEGRPGVGLGLVSHAAQHAPHPWFAIGGIDPSNVAQVVDAGARRLGVVRAIRDAEAPTAAAECAARRPGARSARRRRVAERRKRKERDPKREDRPGARERMESGYAQAEVRNQEAREALEPLADGRAAAGRDGRRRGLGAARALDPRRLPGRGRGGRRETPASPRCSPRRC